MGLVNPSPAVLIGVLVILTCHDLRYMFRILSGCGASTITMLPQKGMAVDGVCLVRTVVGTFDGKA